MPWFSSCLLIIFNSLFFIYQDNGTFDLIVDYWTADEEMLLLDAIEQHGLGNWYVYY